jgi:hypothetical protein
MISVPRISFCEIVKCVLANIAKLITYPFQNLLWNGDTTSNKDLNQSAVRVYSLHSPSSELEKDIRDSQRSAPQSPSFNLIDKIGYCFSRIFCCRSANKKETRSLEVLQTDTQAEFTTAFYPSLSNKLIEHHIPLGDPPVVYTESAEARGVFYKKIYADVFDDCKLPAAKDIAPYINHILPKNIEKLELVSVSPTVISFNMTLTTEQKAPLMTGVTLYVTKEIKGKIYKEEKKITFTPNHFYASVLAAKKTLLSLQFLPEKGELEIGSGEMSSNEINRRVPFNAKELGDYFDDFKWPEGPPRKISPAPDDEKKS